MTMILNALIGLTLAGAGQGQEPRTHGADPYRPRPVPDRVILTWSGDPTTTQSVTWRTDDGTKASFAEIAVAEDGPLFVPKARRIEGIDEPLVTDAGVARCHSATFTGLSPDTLYVYRVGDGTNWSEWGQFRTASATDEPFEFLYLGDAQNEIRAHWSRLIRQAYSDAPKARFMIHAGDLINNSKRDAEWGEWFGAGGWLNMSIPSLPSTGNHEHGGGALTPNWRPQYTLPLNGPSGYEETAYFTDYQGVRIISLNSTRMDQSQATWLDGVLAGSKANWTIVTFHHPIYSAAAKRDNPQIRALLMPIFDRHRVDLVLTGHDHTYARGMGTNPKSATVYVVSVAGPKMYDLEREDWMQRAAEDTQLYQVIRVERGRLRYEARTAAGRLYDAFDLEKRRGAANRLVDKKPRTPENLRKRSAG